MHRRVVLALVAAAAVTISAVVTAWIERDDRTASFLDAPASSREGPAMACGGAGKAGAATDACGSVVQLPAGNASPPRVPSPKEVDPSPAASAPATPRVASLDPAPLPTWTAISGYKGWWDGQATIRGADNIERLAPVLDPSGSGRSVYLMRIMRGDPKIYGGQRAELLWHSRDAYKLVPGRDIWMAFAVMRKPGEAQESSRAFGTTNWNDPYDELLVFQTHTPQAGATQPDIALFYNSQGNYAGWRVAYNTSGTVDSKGWMSTEGNPWVHKEELPAPGVWYRYVVHYRPGYLAAHGPLLEVWRAKPGEAFDKIATHVGFNTYNTGKTGAGPSYPRIGPYGGAGTAVWPRPSYAFYMSPLYFGVGADLFERGKAALEGL